MNTDKLTTAGDPGALRRAAYRVISRTQDEPHIQLLAMAIALIATCDALSVDVRQLLVGTERMRDDLDGAFQSQFAALREYAQKEIGR